MNLLSKVFVPLIIGLSLNAYAQGPQAKGEMFSKIKEQRLKDLETRMQHLQEEKGCLSSSQSQQDFQKCMEPLRAKRHQDRKQRQQERIDSRIQNLQEQKQKLNETK